MKHLTPVPVEAASRSNSSGIALLHSGNAKAAEMEFKYALSQLQLHLASDLPSDTSVFAGYPSFQLIEAPLLADERFYFFNQTIHYSLGDQEALPQSHSHVAYITAATLLNLALAIHQVGIHCDKAESRRRKLTQSAKLYGTVIGLVESNEIQQSDIANFLLLVSLNNQALLSHELGRVEAARKQYDHLVKRSQELQDTGCWSRLFSERLYIEFMLNSIFMSSTSSAACA